MLEDESNKAAKGIDRRDFLRRVGAGTITLNLASTAGGEPLHSLDESQDDELLKFYPGARFLTGPWRLRIDRENAGKQQQWQRQEPSDSVAPVVAVQVPACWQVFVPDFSGGIGWYFKEFRLPAELKGQVLRLKFWAVDYFAEVWVNGEEVGRHEGGYTPFELDITRQAKQGEENRLAVRVVDPPRARKQGLAELPGWVGLGDGEVDGFKFMEIPMGLQSWQEGLNFGGIWQPVELLATDPVYVSDVFIEPKLRGGTIEAHVVVTNKQAQAVEGTVQVKVRPWKGETKEVSQGERAERFSPGVNPVDLRLEVKEPHPWSPEDPYLYVAEVSVRGGGQVRHSATERFGFREFTVKDGYFHLNGKRIFIKGGHHQGTYPATLQFPPTREFAYREVKTIKEAGFNFSRLWQKPTPFPFLDAADELGLLLQIEPPLGNMQDSPYLLGRATREVTELIKRDRNRASIVLWNMINENDPPVKVVRQLCRAARELDPTRLITESAGGPSRFYLPGSSQGVSYLTEHPYPGAPIAEDVYDYQASRGVPGQLCFFSEYGYGGMNDLDSVLARYGDHPRTHMEDYAGHVKLKQRREKGFAESGLLRSVFGDLAGWREASQAVQAETVRWHTEAMRSNPVAGGYNYVQVFDSNAIEIDGLVDFWRERRKQAFEAMQEVNQPLQLIIRCTPMNARAGEEVKVRVTLVNEERIGGQKRLRVGVKSPGGREVWRREENVEAKPWVTVVYEGGVKVEGETGRYGVEAVLWEGSKAVVRKEDYYTVFAAEDMKWPREGVVVFDPEEKLERYLKGRGVRHEGLGLELEGPAVIMVTGFTALWRRPEEYRKFMHLFSQVERGCSALFLGVPSDGVSLLAATHIGQDTFLSPFALEAISPFSRITSTEEGRGQQRIGPYGWGLTEVLAGVPIAKHAIFEGLPGSGLMGREYGNVLPVEEIQTDWKTSEDIGSVLQIYNYGRGKIILTSFNLLPNLDRDALAEKLLSNLVNYAAQNLPSTLEPERPETAEKLGFEDQGYQDCLAKYVKKS